ncbi:MAG TPA: cellulase family glycosylhydrolase, partial [Verrucomicrobiae bacterium]|nr:cellulase family glycosylhydrolase [Verrucomicrobiae bacterium]
MTTDPFDFAATDVRVQILQPDQTTVSLPAFFDGGQTWRVRHSPSLAGSYQIAGVTLNGQPASVTGLQPSNWVVSGWPASTGFVAVDPSNPSRFVTSDGHRFFPLGHDVAWDVNSKTNVVSILAKLGGAQENWSRIWMDHWDGKNLDWPAAGGLGGLNLTVARKWDAIAAAAEQAGVHFQMTLHHHGQYSTTVDPNWPQNPYNAANGGFLSDATQFFTNATAKALTKRKLRYAIARWGYSPAVMAWELFNEVQFTDAAQKGQWTNVAAWHNEMAQFIRAQDPYHHLITTSSQLDQRIWDGCDYYQHHDYPTDLISALRDPQGVPSGQPVKPIFGGECGMEDIPSLGFQGPLWAGLMAGQSGAAQQWYWDHVDADNAYGLFRSAQRFILLSGLADQDTLTKSAPHVVCPVNSALVFGPGGGWASAVETRFTVGDSAPVGIGTLPSFLQGSYHRAAMGMPNGYTFYVNYSQAGSFSVQVTEIAASGASLMIVVDNVTTNRINWPAPGADTPTNFVLTVTVPPEAQTVHLTNPGLDWVNLGNITLDPYTPILGA